MNQQTPPSSSYRHRIKQKLHLRRRSTTASHSSKLNSHDDFKGIALLTLINAEMKFKDKWLACISIGEQTFRTDVSHQTDKPTWNSDPIETEKSFARRILSIVDYDGDGKLSFSEFSELTNAFGNQLAANKKEELFKAADINGDGVVSMDELATLLALQQEKEPLINCCPVCGERLEISDKLNSMIHMSLCFDEGTGNQIMTGGFLTDSQASYGWMFKLSEWAHVSSYDVGLNSGSSGSHIVVFDRQKMQPNLVLSND